MTKSKMSNSTEFSRLLAEVKSRIQAAQTRALLAVNTELVRLYWDIGRMIDQRQEREGWGAAVIPRLASELHNELPDVKGFSERNIIDLCVVSELSKTASSVISRGGRTDYGPFPRQRSISSWCSWRTNTRTPSRRAPQSGDRRLPNCALSQMGNNWLPKYCGRTTCS